MLRFKKRISCPGRRVLNAKEGRKKRRPLWRIKGHTGPLSIETQDLVSRILSCLKKSEKSRNNSRLIAVKVKDVVRKHARLKGG